MPKWVKGQSGNPSGKPPGTSKIAEYRRMIEGKAPDLVETCIRLALSGDTVAMRLCIERLIPAFKNIDPPVILPRAGDNDMEVQAGYILDSLLSGGLAPDLALKILQGLQVHYALTELKDLAARITRLEETKTMIPINSLEGKVSKLERQRKVHIRFEMVEEHWPGDGCFGECDLAFKRNGETIARFPRKLTVTEWEAKFNPNHN